MIDIYTRLHTFIHQDLWRDDFSTRTRWGVHCIRSLRVTLVLWRDITSGQLTLRAMGLVYTSLLSLVPLLAVSFSMLKAFGVHNQVQPLLEQFLSPLGAMGNELTLHVLGFVDKVEVGVLGTLGLTFLVFTVIALIQKIENSFNYVWRTKRTRSLHRRFSDYLSVIMIGPVLVFSAMGLTAAITSTVLVQKLLAIEPFGSAMLFMSTLMPYLLIIAAFTFVYIFVPNTRVKLSSAFIGAVVAGILWQVTGLVFASFAASSTSYEAIYSGFAILVMFMIWLYLSWLILLFGAQVAYYHQHPQQIRRFARQLRLSNRLKEHVGLLIMSLIASHYVRGDKPWTLDKLVTCLELPADVIDEILDNLKRENFLSENAEDPPGYLPSRDLESISLIELIHALRCAEEHTHIVNESLLDIPEVNQVMAQISASTGDALTGLTLRNLVSKETLAMSLSSENHIT